MRSILIIRAILGGVVVVAALSSASAKPNLPKPSYTHNPAAGHVIGGPASDGGGWVFKNGRFKPVPPMAPVMPGEMRR